MKNNEAFKKAFKKVHNTSHSEYVIRLIKQEAWEACEEFYESRKCEDCKYMVDSHHCRIIPTVGIKLNNFSCKHWEAKK